MAAIAALTWAKDQSDNWLIAGLLALGWLFLGGYLIFALFAAAIASLKLLPYRVPFQPSALATLIIGVVAIGIGLAVLRVIGDAVSSLPIS
ncbi:hypothetical protein [Brevundimonas naejangsanensis]|uniref:hypothetical protein n=1 Tax=Brevundimonas naejangsanensis TaxID=588932 RepID=UPI003D049E04